MKIKLKLSAPHRVGLFAVLPLLLTWIATILPRYPGQGLAEFCLTFLALPWLLLIDSIIDHISIALTSHLPPARFRDVVLFGSVLLNGGILYFAGWGITRFVMDKRHPNKVLENTGTNAPDSQH